MSTFERHVYLAKVAEQCENYEEMVKHVKAMAKSAPGPLGTEHRNLLSVAFKNVVGACRASWRALNAYESSREAQENKELRGLIDEYRKGQVEAELRTVARDLLATVDGIMERERKEADTTSRVFFLKTKGDYYRYLAEVEGSDTDSGVRDKAEKAYLAAQEEAGALEPTNPIRLGLALNLSVFLYEICHRTQDAMDTAKEAFDEAIKKLDMLHDADYKDATLIMQLIRDNLTLWSQDADD